MRFYTIFLGNRMFQNVIDDMNATEPWAIGGHVWNSRQKATKCLNMLKNPEYSIEDKKRKLRIVELLPANDTEHD